MWGKRAVWPLLIPLGLVAMWLACNGSNGPVRTVDITLATPTPTPIPTPTAVPTPSPTPTPTPTPTPDVCGANPDPAPPSLLQVEEPEPRTQVRLPFHVRGWGSTIGRDEMGVVVAVIDRDGGIVQVLDVPPHPRVNRIAPRGIENTDFLRPFAADILLTDLAGPTPFCIWVFPETDEEGNPKGVLQIPVVVAP